jgi:hypothetical protein
VSSFQFLFYFLSEKVRRFRSARAHLRCRTTLWYALKIYSLRHSSFRSFDPSIQPSRAPTFTVTYITIHRLCVKRTRSLRHMVTAHYPQQTRLRSSSPQWSCSTTIYSGHNLSGMLHFSDRKSPRAAATSSWLQIVTFHWSVYCERIQVVAWNRCGFGRRVREETHPKININRVCVCAEKFQINFV